MKRYTLIFATLLSLLIPAQGYSASLLDRSEEGKLYFKGLGLMLAERYSEAMEILLPLAEKGEEITQ